MLLTLAAGVEARNLNGGRWRGIYCCSHATTAATLDLTFKSYLNILITAFRHGCGLTSAYGQTKYYITAVLICCGTVDGACRPLCEEKCIGLSVLRTTTPLLLLPPFITQTPFLARARCDARQPQGRAKPYYSVRGVPF